MAGSEVRKPRGRVLLDGQEAAGFKAFETTSNGFYQADTFLASLALYEQPAGRGIDYWSSVDSVRVEVQASVGGSYESVFIGEADGIVVDPLRGVIEIDGRDLSADMIQTRATEKFLNLRTHRVAERIAKARGLKVVAPQSKTIVGTLFGEDTTEISARYSEWDLLTFLAQREGRDVYVQGDTLYYVPKAEESAAVLTLRAPKPNESSDFKTFQFQRNLILARDITVRVVSYDYLSGDTVKKTAKAKHTRGSSTKSGSLGTRSTYVRTIPNLSPEQAEARAQAELAEISKHEVRFFFSGPARTGLRPLDRVRVVGSGSRFDQDYFIDEIVRSFSFDDGYVWTVRGKNSMPVNQVVE